MHSQEGTQGEDYELVVAESLCRNLVSRVLDKGIVPVPRSAWTRKTGYKVAFHDRAACFAGTNLIDLGVDDPSSAPARRERLLHRVLKEGPDDFGGDLVVIFE